MKIGRIRSALEFARTRTPAGGPVSSQAEAGLMALEEVEREFGAARALIEKAAKAVGPYGLMGPLHAELRAFLDPVTPGEVGYTFGDAPNPPDSSPLPPAVCMKCGDDRNQPSKFCDHGKATPKPAACGWRYKVLVNKHSTGDPLPGQISMLDISRTTVWGDPGQWRYSDGATKPDVDWMCVAEPLYAAPCNCAGLRGNQRQWDLIRQMRMELHQAELITNEEYAQLTFDHPAVARLESYDALRAELAAMTADRNQWKTLKDRVEEEKARLQGELAVALERAEKSEKSHLLHGTLAGIDCDLPCEMLWPALIEKVKQMEADLAAALEREREAMESLRYWAGIAKAIPFSGEDTKNWMSPAGIRTMAQFRDIAAIVAAFDALQAEVLRDFAKGDC